MRAQLELSSGECKGEEGRHSFKGQRSKAVSERAVGALQKIEWASDSTGRRQELERYEWIGLLYNRGAELPYIPSGMIHSYGRK